MSERLSTDMNAIVLDVLSRAPDWLRRDLASDQVAQRKQAEETLMVMLTAALTKATERQSRLSPDVPRSAGP